MTLILGVLNVTPDSFSDGGQYVRPEVAIRRGHELLAAGADIIDVGGESTRPGAAPVSAAEECRRIVPVIEALAREGVRISVDTVHAATARAAVDAGAIMINDVSGGQHDPEMYRVAAETGVQYIAMHWRGIPDPGHRRSHYRDVVTEVCDELRQLADAAVAAGVDPGQLILDPGLGFDKTAEQGWRVLAGLSHLRDVGYPVLIGVSRKRMLGDTLGEQATMADRDLATAVVSALASGDGVWGVRVHDVAASRTALTIADAWKRATPLPAPAVDPRATSLDRITVTGLEVFAHHGVFDFERANGQRFVIDAEVSLDLRTAAVSDTLADTVHYGELAEAIAAAVATHPVDLIETVAERVANVALGFAGVAEARVTVHKPDAPIAAHVTDVSVTIVRQAAGVAR